MQVPLLRKNTSFQIPNPFPSSFTGNNKWQQQDLAQEPTQAGQEYVVLT